MIGGVLLPALGLGALAWALPRLLARAFPEGVGPLVALGLVAAALMWALASGLFLALYVAGGLPAGRLLEALGAGAGGHVLRLGAASALIWGPVLVLSVAGLPSRWTEETW